MFVCINGNKHYWQLFSFITCNGLNIGIYWSKIHGTDSLKPFSFEVKSTEAFIPKKHINNKLYPQVYIVLKEEKNFKQKTQAQHILMFCCSLKHPARDDPPTVYKQLKTQYSKFY